MNKLIKFSILGLVFILGAQACAMEGEISTKDIPKLSYSEACKHIGINPDISLLDLVNINGKKQREDIDPSDVYKRGALMVIQNVADNASIHRGSIRSHERIIGNDGWFKRRVEVKDIADTNDKVGSTVKSKCIREYQTTRYNYPRIAAATLLGVTGLVATGYCLWKNLFNNETMLAKIREVNIAEKLRLKSLKW